MFAKIMTLMWNFSSKFHVIVIIFANSCNCTKQDNCIIDDKIAQSPTQPSFRVWGSCQVENTMSNYRENDYFLCITWKITATHILPPNPSRRLEENVCKQMCHRVADYPKNQCYIYSESSNPCLHSQRPAYHPLQRQGEKHTRSLAADHASGRSEWQMPSSNMTRTLSLQQQRVLEKP